VDPRNEQDIAAALAEVAGSEQVRRRLRELGLARAQTLSWRETARQTLAVINELVPLQNERRAADRREIESAGS
jgi:glycosyltransferase involved in cell wall biosynthesis